MNFKLRKGFFLLIISLLVIIETVRAAPHTMAFVISALILSILCHRQLCISGASDYRYRYLDSPLFKMTIHTIAVGCAVMLQYQGLLN
jgi:hypothetical protein